MPAGDILVFLTGQEEIESLQLLLQERSKLLPKDSKSLLVWTSLLSYHRYILFMLHYHLTSNWLSSHQPLQTLVKLFFLPILLNLLWLFKGSSMSLIQEWPRFVFLNLPQEWNHFLLFLYPSHMLGNVQVELVVNHQERWDVVLMDWVLVFPVVYWRLFLSPRWRFSSRNTTL